jgi:predicted protein tyrosine phosphatase
MSMILVAPFSAVFETIEKYRPSHLVTLLSEKNMIDTPAEIRPENHLKLALSDIADPAEGLAHPQREHVERLIAFGRAWGGAAPMLVHCWAGVSRSMAAAFILLCDRAPNGAEYAIAKKMRARAAHANPNRLLVELADGLLEREGRLIDAVGAMGRAKFVEEGVPVEFPLDVMTR